MQKWWNPASDNDNRNNNDNNNKNNNDNNNKNNNDNKNKNNNNNKIIMIIIIEAEYVSTMKLALY